MKTTLLGKITLSFIFLLFVFSSLGIAQTDEGQVKKVNFRYSQNPKTRAKSDSKVEQKAETGEAPIQVLAETGKAEVFEPKASIAKKTLEIAKKASVPALMPTEIYKVGVADVLFINLLNSPKSSTYFTVLNDGTIDYPLAGEMVSVEGLTTEEIENLLKEKVKVFENLQISVKVREYSSHTYSVIGLVERSGEKKLQREAIPLYVVRAESLVQPQATSAVIRRTNSQTETINLKDKNADDVLIFSGDIIEFTGERSALPTFANGFYFIGGEIVNGGQKDFHNGLTLTQAILASGGLKKGGVKKVVVRRKNNEGMLVPTEYNLKTIKEGKTPDPLLKAGDTIEIGM